MTEGSTDLSQFGPTAEGQSVIDAMMESGAFGSEWDAASLAMSLAMVNGVRPEASPRGSNKWGANTFDRDGHLKRLIPLLYPGNDTPYRTLMGLVEEGLKLVKAQIDKTGAFDLYTVLEPLRTDTDAKTNDGPEELVPEQTRVA